MKPAQHQKKNGPAQKEELKLLRRITVDPKILVGKPTIRGLRISVEQILSLLGQGMTAEEIRREFPMLEGDDIQAALLYAAKVLAEEKIYPAEPVA